MSDTNTLTGSEIAARLYIRDRVIRPRSKRTGLQNPEFRGNNLMIQSLEIPEMVLEGAAGTGKTIAILYKLHKLAEKYPGIRIILVRKTRESMNETVLAAFEKDVLGEGNPLIPRGQRNARHSYRYPNGSEIIVGGLQASGVDQRERIMSSSYDVAYVCECSELTEGEWNRLTTRLRNGRMPNNFIMGDLNPTSPSHWLYTREAKGITKIFQTFHKDNPYLFDGNDWTKNGKDYIAKLSNLTGVDRARYLEGKREATTGLVYSDVYSEAGDGNITEQAEFIPDGGDVWWAVDDGYAGQYDEQLEMFTAQSHPRAFLLAQVRHDGKVCVFAESFKVKTLPEAHIKEVESLGYPEPFRIVVDKSAVDLQGRLRDKYNVTQQTIVDVEEGIKLVRNFLAPDENGVRKLLIHPRCRFTRFEFLSYKRDEKERIIKEFDHSLDGIRYFLSVVGAYAHPNFRTLG